MFVDEIEKLRASFFATCSDREKLFYCFITKQPYEGIVESPAGDLDKICFAVFRDEGLDISKEIQKIAPAIPYKHIHYSSSIITLIPVCLKSEDAKNKYLLAYFNSHSLAEKLLLTKVFSAEKFQFVSHPSTELDKLIDETFFNPNFNSATQHLPTAFLEVNDIVSLLAFRAAYLELLKIQPNTVIEEKFYDLSREVEILIKTITKRIHRTIDILTLIIFVCASPVIVLILNNNYDKLQIARLSDIWTFVSPLIFAVIYFSRKLFPQAFYFYERFKQKLIERWFLIRKTNYQKLLMLINKNI